MIGRRRQRWVVALVPLAVMLTAGSGHAQSVGTLLPISLPGFGVSPGVTAASRLHREYEPIGMSFGAADPDLRVFPALSAGVGVDTAPAAGQRATPVISLAPGLRFEDNVIGLAGFATASLTRDGRDPAADSNDVSAGVGLAYPLGPDRITVGLARVSVGESALGLARNGGAAALRVVTDDGRIGARMPFGMFVVAGRIEASTETPSVAAGALEPGFQDRTALRLVGDLATLATGPLRWLIRIKTTKAWYRDPVPGSGFADAADVSIMSGFSTDPAAVLRMRLLAGVVRQHSAAGSAGTGVTPVFDMATGWTPDGLISVAFDVAREAGIETVFGTPGHVETTGHFALAEAYRRDLLLTAGITARLGTIAGHAAREIDLTAGATWHVSRAVTVQPEVFVALRHDLPGSAPRETTIMLSLNWAP